MSQIGDSVKRLPLKREIAECDEWATATGKAFFIQELSGEERLEYERKQLEGGLDAKGELDKRKFVNSMKSLRQDIVVQSLVDEHGEPVFDDISDLKSVSGEIVTRLADQAMKVSRLLPDDLEDAVGNSEEGQTAATG